MNELRWEKSSVKWGGKDYGRSIWSKPGYTLDGGKIHGPDCDGVTILEHLKTKGLHLEVEIIQ
jgi:hypothetical protein